MLNCNYTYAAPQEKERGIHVHTEPRPDCVLHEGRILPATITSNSHCLSQRPALEGSQQISSMHLLLNH